MAQPVVQVRELVKRYGEFTAVDRLSFQVEEGEVFGLLGPNGAGKSSTIRILMGILLADGGEVRILGAERPGQVRHRVGYLPEERGLYRNGIVLEVLEYLGGLKGLAPAEARRRGQAWLERMGLADWARKKVRDLSRGMQQKLQIAATLLHDPELVILDEPFQGLDPVNIQLVKELIRELQAQGRTVLLSSHQLHHVEALADRVLLIHRGRGVVSGAVEELRQRYAEGAVEVELAGKAELPPDLPGLLHRERRDGRWRVALAEGVAPQAFLATLVERQLPVTAFQVALPTLEEIFVKAVSEG